MRYLPAVAVAISVGGAVAYGLYITKNPDCLWGLLLMYIAYMSTPFKENEY
jgi:hypothetical protein